MFRCIRINRENPVQRGKRLSKTRIIDFPWESSHVSRGGGWNSTIKPFFQWKILPWKNHSHFSGAGRGGGEGGGECR